MGNKRAILAAVIATLSTGMVPWAAQGADARVTAERTHTATLNLYVDAMDNTDVRGPCTDGK